MARPRKPTSMLKLEGVYQKAWHGDRTDEPKPTGNPRTPPGLEGDAREFWERNVPRLVAMGVATSADEDALATMAMWWGLGCELLRAPTDQRSKTWIYELACVNKNWRDLAARFGMTPADRAKITVQRQQELDPAAEFVA